MLINFAAMPGASNRPDVTATASCHGDTVNTDRPHRATTARATATIAATASASSEPAGSGTPGSGSTAQASAMNAERSGPAREQNRRSQPRTVAAGHPNRTAIRR